MSNFWSIEYTEQEQQLARFELSWVDFAAHVRTGTNVRRADERSETLSVDGLLLIHALLDMYREDFEDGDNYALMQALAYCCEKNVPLPYWAANGYPAVFRRLVDEPVSLHDLLHVDRHFRASGKRARKDRDQWKHGVQIWAEAKRLMEDEGVSRDVAIDRVLSTGRFPFQKSTAIKLFEKIDEAQARYLKIRRQTQ